MKNYLRSGNLWSVEEDSQLDKAYSVFINKLAILHSRSVNAIKARLEDYTHPVKFQEPTTCDASTNTD